MKYFTNLKIEKVLSKYFVISEEEKKKLKIKNVKRFITEKVTKLKLSLKLKKCQKL